MASFSPLKIISKTKDFAKTQNRPLSCMRVENRENTMVSVKTASPVPKENIFDVMELIKKTSVKAPVKIGDVILTNIFGTDIIATKDIIWDRELEDISILFAEKGINQGG